MGLKPDEYQNRYPHQMSGGERQRVGIASALVLGPELVIADEPVSMLDVSIRAGILDLIRDLSQRLRFTCIFVSHDLSILSNISERLMIMYLGKVMELGTIREIIAEPLHPYAQALISAVPIPDPSYKRPRPAIKGEVSQPIDPPPGCRFHTRCPQGTMEACELEDPPMKEVKPGAFRRLPSLRECLSVDSADLGREAPVKNHKADAVPPMPDTIVCRCESVSLGQIGECPKSAAARTVNEVKKLTRAGMGICQGRTVPWCGEPGSSIGTARHRRARNPIRHGRRCGRCPC